MVANADVDESPRSLVRSFAVKEVGGRGEEDKKKNNEKNHKSRRHRSNREL